MRRFRWFAGSVLALVFCEGTGDAKERQAPPPPGIILEFGRCRALADGDARLRCFDAAADQLASALTSKKVYVLNREDVQATRRSLFGLPVPADTIIGAEDDGNGVDHLNAKVAGATQDADGNLTVTMDNGTVWKQTDGYALARSPRRDDAVLITRAALGSFRMKIAGQPAVRARRVR